MPGVNGVTLKNNLIKVAPLNESKSEVIETAQAVEESVENTVEHLNDIISNAEETANEVESLIEDISDDGEFNDSNIKRDNEIESVTETEVAEEIAEEIEETQSERVELIEEKPIVSNALSIFNSIEKLLLKLYDGVFSKNPSFTPTLMQTLNDLTSFIANKCAKMGVFSKFLVAFNCDESVLSESINYNDYVPYAIKLTAFIDKQTNSNCTSQVIKDLTKIFIELIKDKENYAQIISNEMSAIYSFALSYNIKFL